VPDALAACPSDPCILAVTSRNPTVGFPDGTVVFAGHAWVDQTSGGGVARLAVHVKNASPSGSEWVARARQSLAESAHGGLAREALLVALAIVAYFAIRNATAGGANQAAANAGRILRLENWLGVAWEQQGQGLIVGHDVLVMLTNWIYIWGHWPVVLGVATLLFLYRRDRYYLLRNALFVSGAIGFLFFAFFPVAPPRLVDSALVDTVTNESSSYRALQPPGLTNQYAAFPSLHFGWNLVIGVVLFLAATHLAVRLFAVVGPLAMGFAVVATANHFVLDVVAGVCVVGIGLVVAFALDRRRDAATLARSECGLDDD
jgi:PAP2 superfamily